jgi:type I restriction enzyme S subunit
LSEQSEILQRLHKETEPTDKSVAWAAREVELLREYRTRLLSDVVTGKLDVRAAAAALPDEELDIEDADEPDLDEADSDLDGDDDLSDEDAAE